MPVKRANYRGGPLLAVRSTADLDLFVKEAELLTRHAGRRFFVRRQDQPARQLRIAINAYGYDVCQLFDRSETPAELLAQEAIERIIADGMLYTDPIKLALPLAKIPSAAALAGPKSRRP